MAPFVFLAADPGLTPGPLYASAVAAVVVGFLGLVGTRLTLRVQHKNEQNEERLTQYEGWRELIEQTRIEKDRAIADRDRIRDDRDHWRGRALRAERQVETWLKETP